MENVVDSVLHTFLSARGEREGEGESWGVSPPPLSDVDTGISPSSGRHRDGCPNGSYLSCHLPKPVPTPVPPFYLHVIFTCIAGAGEDVGSGHPTTGIIVVAVVCCVLGTSLVWVIIIYHTRRRSNTQVGGGQINRLEGQINYKREVEYIG